MDFEGLQDLARWKIQQLENSFRADVIFVPDRFRLVSVGLHSDVWICRGLVGSFIKHVGDLGHHFGIIWVIIGCKGPFRWDLECPRVDFHRFVMDLGSPDGHHSGLLFFIFSLIGSVHNRFGLQTCFFDDR